MDKNMTDHNELQKRFHYLLPTADYCSLRWVKECSDRFYVRRNVVEPPSRQEDEGIMITVVRGGGLGYAATPDFSRQGLRRAIERACQWADASAALGITDFSAISWNHSRGNYHTPVTSPWSVQNITQYLEILRQASERLGTSPHAVEWHAGMWRTSTQMLLLTNEGGRVEQMLEHLSPSLSLSVNKGSETITRSRSHAEGAAQQGGIEILERIGFINHCDQLVDEAEQLLAAPNCPKGNMDLLLMPDQMMLQIHESIGHPLELDRILGDERNYAGTSFVTPPMFGHYQYGSALLNITFDPTIAYQYASYGFDDDGTTAQKVFIIRDGILQRPLGSLVSGTRAGMPSLANARATSWNRAPIDRMANLNLEPGDKSMDELISGIEHGILMQTNTSWSIDDSRNKFQFGCQLGRIIEEGQLKGLVKKPNYRGISATFWRNLKAVGDPTTFEVHGTPYCGKGEPNQIIRVGHASPACVFADVDVFGGDQ
jgi:predicted Zn-dependent protease